MFMPSSFRIYSRRVMSEILQILSTIHREVSNCENPEKLMSLVDSHFDFFDTSLDQAADSVMEKILEIFLIIQNGNVQNFSSRVIPLIARVVPRNISEDTAGLVADFLLRSEGKKYTGEYATLVPILLSRTNVKGCMKTLSLFEMMDRCDDAIDPLDVAKTVSQFLAHKNSRIRLSALSAINSIIRWRPWISTYPILSWLLGRREDPNMVELGEFYDENFSRKNFIACLIHDDREEIRTAMFHTLVDWVSELDDRADIELHLLPFILIGELESKNNSVYFNEKRPDATEYVQRYARKFIPALFDRIDCDFLTINRSNRDKLLIHTFKYLGSSRIGEFVTNIFQLIRREGMNENFMFLIDLVADSGIDWWKNLQENDTEICIEFLRRGQSLPVEAMNWFAENKDRMNCADEYVTYTESMRMI